MRPIDEHKLWNGNYLLIAIKENQHTLFTFDPQSLTSNKLNIPLPTYSTAILTIAAIDNQSKKVYLLGLSPTQPKPSALKLFTIDLVSNSINDPQEFCTATPSDYYVSSYASGLLPDGRIFITGGTTSTDYYYNFNPVKYTLLINPSYIQTFTLTVVKSGPGIGIVTSTVAGITCGIDCSQAYPSGITLTLNATPIEGSIFTGWSGDCAPNGQVQMDDNKTCVA